MMPFPNTSARPNYKHPNFDNSNAAQTGAALDLYVPDETDSIPKQNIDRGREILLLGVKAGSNGREVLPVVVEPGGAVKTTEPAIGKQDDDVADDPNEEWSVISLLKGVFSVVMSLFDWLVQTTTAQAQTTGVVTNATIQGSKALTVYALSGTIQVSNNNIIVAIIPEGGTFAFDRKRWLQYPEYTVSGGEFIVNYFIV